MYKFYEVRFMFTREKVNEGKKKKKKRNSAAFLEGCV